MRLRIVAGGRVREKHLRVALDDYLKRLAHYLPIDESEVFSGKGVQSIRAFERAIPTRYEIWALDSQGIEPTSEELASWLDARMTRGVKGIALAIGGAEGLPRQIVSRADLLLSLSKLTLPHRIARLVLAEQLYRAMTIIRGEPYHK